MRILLATLLLATSGCIRIGPAPVPGLLAVEQQVWWNRLVELCGGAFPGRLAERGSADDRYARERLVARVDRCAADTVDVAFDVGEERTRTWRITRSAAGLRLRHLHSDADGTAGAPTGYGGYTPTPGSARQQDFLADSATVRMLPPARGNVWSVEIDPGRTLTYTLGRPGIRQRFRVEFDLARPLRPETPAPSAP